MRSNGFLLVIVGTAILYVALSGKYPLVERFAHDLVYGTNDGTQPTATPAPASSTPRGEAVQTRVPNPFTGRLPTLAEIVRTPPFAGESV